MPLNEPTIGSSRHLDQSLLIETVGCTGQSEVKVKEEEEKPLAPPKTPSKRASRQHTHSRATTRPPRTTAVVKEEPRDIATPSKKIKKAQFFYLIWKKRHEKIKCSLSHHFVFN